MKAPRANRYRSAWAGSLRAGNVEDELRVAGWIHRRRDHGGLIFIDLRDRTGLLQVVFRPDDAPEAHEQAHRLRAEDVISVEGALARREEGTINPSLPTGEVELTAASFDLLSDAETPPFPIDEETPVDEVLRLRHRYLDLRRDGMRTGLELRDAVVAAMREHLRDEGFLEIETPALTRSTPEGARDYIVPSRLQPGNFYALAQSPQLFKQLLMVAGFERYFQIARCFRDEDFRADRQPEFTQLDMEMSFVDEDDVISTCDGLIAHAFATAGIEVRTPLERISYDEAMLRYGTDRPDRRPGMEIHDLGGAFAGTEFKVFRGALEAGKVVRGFRAAGDFPRKRLDELTERAQELGAGGLVWAVVEPAGWRSPIAKFLTDREMNAAEKELGATEEETLFIVADEADLAARVLAQLRLEVAGPVEGYDPFWVTDFPMFGWNEEEERLDPLHHPFVAPAGDLDADPRTWRSRAYDMVMNGWELGGGSIRISEPQTQSKVFEALGLTPDDAQRRFGFLLEAFRYGAPPHGGIAFGLDRVIALLGGRDSIREVIAFPKTASGTDVMMGAPAPADERQLRELGIRVAAPPPDKPG